MGVCHSQEPDLDSDEDIKVQFEVIETRKDSDSYYHLMHCSIVTTNLEKEVLNQHIDFLFFHEIEHNPCTQGVKYGI